MKTCLQFVLLLAGVITVSARPYIQFAPRAAADSGGRTMTVQVMVDALDPAALGTFYLTAAIVPTNSSSLVYNDVGTFRIDGQPVHATRDMIYGTPPTQKSGKTYPAWYKEMSFSFNPSQRTRNEELSNSKGAYHSGGDAYFREFEIDVSGLPEGVSLVFDVYTQGNPRPRSLWDRFLGRNLDTPGSRIPSGGDPVAVPDAGATSALLALGLASLVAARRWSRRA
jgi:hypothetical protein